MQLWRGERGGSATREMSGEPAFSGPTREPQLFEAATFAVSIYLELAQMYSASSHLSIQSLDSTRGKWYPQKLRTREEEKI